MGSAFLGDARARFVVQLRAQLAVGLEAVSQHDGLGDGARRGHVGASTVDAPRGAGSTASNFHLFHSWLLCERWLLLIFERYTTIILEHQYHRRARMLTRELLVTRLRYEPDTGLFYKIPSKGRPARNGPYMAKTTGGYILIRVNGVAYYAHRLAFLYMTGRMPSNLVDHINGKRDDNRFNNLREASDSQNNHNRRAKNSNSSSLLGTTWCKTNKKWKAQITVNRTNRHLGLFKTEQEAHVAYLKAKKIFHAGFCEVASV